MRNVRAAIAVAVASLASSCLVLGQTGQTQGLSITNYQYVSEQRATLTQSNVTYRADIVNPGGALASATATLTSLNVVSFRVVPGQDTLQFGPVPAGGQVTSANTFTILVDRTKPFSWANIQWSFQPVPAAPIANAGPNQTVPVGSTVTLDGSKSTNPSGIGTLTYSWAFKSRPGGTKSLLMNPTSVMPTFVADIQGTWVITLTVSNGVASSSADVTVSTSCVAPTANAGPNQTVTAGATVILNGSQSTDACGLPLTYAWTLSVPSGSTATLTNPNSVSPTFVADKPNSSYVATLIVTNNLSLSSTPATVAINTQTVAPVANAGPNQVVNTKTVVQLDGSKSTDANGLPLTYKWSFNAMPPGSAAVINNPTSVNPTFTADVPGLFVVQLIVNNGVFDSAPSTVNITTNPPLAPTANAGQNQTVNVGSTVQLNCTGTDPQNFPLTYKWALTSKPTGSGASLSSSVIQNPVFVADVAGTYVGQCTVNNGFFDSPPSTVTISTTCTPPVANPGSNQNVLIGATVMLDGSKSSDACHDPLTYKWSFTTMPGGSAAALSGANTATPSFVADLAGTYVVQLIVNNGLADSPPMTVTINASAAPTISLSPKNQDIGTNATGTLTVTLSSAAPAGGQVISLSSNNTGVATVPATVTVPGGANTTTVTVTPVAIGTAQITASANGYSSDTATVNVVALKITLTLDSNTLGLSLTMNGTVTLSAPAPSSGTSVLLSGNPSGIVDVEPPILTIPAGATSGAITVKGLAVGQTTITAIAPGYTTGSANVTVNSLGAISLPATTITVGANQSATLPVTLSQPAPSGGATITLTSGDTTKVTVSPSTVTIAAGATAPAQQPQVTGVNYGSVTITASAPGFNSGTAQVKVAAALGFSPGTQTFPVNTTQNFTLNLAPGSAPAGGLTINLSSDNTAVATVPATVTIPANASTISVPVTGVAQGSATIHASSLPNLADTTALAFVTFFGNVVLSGPATIPLGQSASFPVSLSAPAPAGGTTVTLVSSDTSKLTISPTTVAIAGGQTTPASQPQITGVNLGPSTITASAPGFSQANQTVRVTATLSFSPSSLTITGPVTQNLTLNLSATTPAAVTINLSSDNTGVATVPATVTIPANANSVSVPVTGVAKGSTTIHASSLPNVPDATASVTVNSFGAINLPANPTVALGQSTPLAVTLSAAAPTGGVTVTLASSDSSKLTISPATVTIAAGQTTPSSPPAITGVNIGAATITATAPGWDNGSAPAQVTATVSFSSALSIIGTQTQNFTLTLSANAPAAGVTVNLSSSNAGVATVPATATFAAGSNTATVPVTGVAQGTAVIHASNLPYIPDATGNVTVTPGVINVPPSPLTLQLGGSADFAISLASPAPTGGVTVTLTSTNPSIVSVTSSVTIAAGQTTPSTQPRVNGLAIGSSSVTASASGYTQGTQTVNVTLTISFSPTSLTINGATTKNLTLNLSGTAPTGGLTFSISANPTGIVSVPSTVTVAGQNSVTVPVTGAAMGSTVITASMTGVTPATANVTVQSDITFNPANLTIAVGQTVGGSAQRNLYINLTNPNNAGVSVGLSSSDVSKVTVSPQNVFIPAGSQQSAVVQVTGVGIGSANVIASAFGLMSGSLPVQVIPGATIAFSPNTLSLNAQTQQNLVLTLSAAQSTSLTVNLSSDNAAVATVPPTATFPANVTSINVLVTGFTAGTTLIHASALPSVADTTATVTVIPPVVQPSLIVPANTTVNLGQSTTFPVTVAQAPSSDLAVSLASNNTANVTISPASVTIPAGQTASSITPQVTGAGIGSANITAAATGYTSGVGAVTVPAPAFSWAGPITIIAGNSGNLTLNLSNGQGPSPNGLTVNLGSDNTSAATVPPSVIIPAGQTSVQVLVTGVAQGSANITASATGIQSVTVAVTVNQQPPAGSISVSSPTVGTNQTTPINITLSAAASADTTVTLSSDNTGVATVPASVVIPAGQTAPVTQPMVTGVSGGTAHITGSASGYTSGIGNVTVTPLVLNAADPTITPTTTGTINLSLTGGVAPAAGLTVNLVSDHPEFATVQTPVSFAGGGTTATATVTGVAAGTATITASTTNPSLSATAKVTVQPLPVINIAPVSVGLGLTAPLQVSVQNAVSADLTVTLTPSDNTKVSLSTTTVTIPAGQTQPTTAPTVTGLAVGSPTITPSATGYVAGTTGPVTVTPVTATFTPQPLTVNPGAQGTLTLTLTGGKAPTGGLTVNLNSSNTNLATVPASVTFNAGDTTATVTVSVPSNATGGQATITASNANFSANATATVTVPGTIIITNTSVNLGGTATLTVNVSPAPASPLTITLVSNDTTKVTVSPSIIIAGGASSATATVTGISPFTPSTTVTGSATGYTSGSGTVTVNATIGLSCPANIPVSATPTNCTLTLSGNAPTGGLPVNLTSSDSTTASVPASVTIPAGSTTVTVPMTGVKTGGPVTITASVPNTAIANATATVNVVQQSITIPNISVNLGGTATLTVNVSPAPSSPLTVNLVSNDTTKVTVPATVTIATGATSGTVTVNGLSPITPSATITGSATNYTSGTGTVTVNATMTLPSGTQSVTVGQQLNLTLTLSANAPTGGIPVSLSSSDSMIASVPPSVTIPAGSNTATVQVTGVKAGGPITITASAANTTISNATVQVNVTPPIPITVSSSGPTLGGTASVTVSVPSAPTSPLTINLVSNDTTKATVSPASVTITAPATSATATVTGVSPITPSTTITGSTSNPNYTSGSGTVTVGATITLPSGPQQVFLGQQTNLTLTLSGNAPTGGLLVNLSSSDSTTASVPASVTIAAGTKTAIVQVTGVKVGGPVTITASVPNTAIVNATASVTVVQLPQITVANTSVTLGGTANLTVSIPAALGSPLVINLTSNDTSKVTVSSSVTIPAGSTNANATVTGVSPITPSTTVTGSATGYTSGSGTVTVTASIGLSGGTQVMATQVLNLTLTLSGNAPTGGLLVNLASSDSTTASVPSSVTIPAGTKTATVQVTGVKVGGPVTITATVPNTAITPATASVTVNPLVINSITVPNVLVAPGQTVPLNVSLPGPAPSGGVTVNLASNTGGTYATLSSSTVTIPAGSTTPTTPPTVTGVSAFGTAPQATITGSATGYTSGSGTVTVAFLVGQNLQNNVTIQLPSAPAQGTAVNLTSSDSTKLLIAGSPTRVGAAQYSFVSDGSNMIGGVYLQGLPLSPIINSALVPVTVSFPGFSAQANVMVTPSGFALAGPLGATYIGSSGAFSIAAGQHTGNTLTVVSARLDSNLNFVESQMVSPGAGTVNVNVTSDNTTVGTITASPVSFVAPSQTGTTNFNPLTIGTANLTAVAPSGFSTPAGGANIVPATVTGAALNFAPTTSFNIGNNLEVAAQIHISGSVTSPLTINVSSNNANVKLSNAANTAGTSSISVQILCPLGNCQTTSQIFYVQGFASSGTLTNVLTATAGGFSSANATVNLFPSGFVIASASGVGAGFIQLFTTPTALYVYPARLNSSLAYAEIQALAGGLTASMNVTSSNTGVGTITTSPVAVTTASDSSSVGTTSFQPVPQSIGLSTLSVSAPSSPPGFSTPTNDASLTADVRLGQCSVTSGTVGNKLQLQGMVSLASPAPAGGTSVTLTSQSPSLLLAVNPASPSDWKSSITVTIPGGSTTGTYYMEGLASTGSATVSSTCVGTGTIPLAPSGVVVAGSNGTPGTLNLLGQWDLEQKSNSPVNFFVYTAVLNPSDNSWLGLLQPLAVGQPALSVTLTSSNTNAATIQSPASIPGDGSGFGTATFTMLQGSGATTTVSVTQPAGFVATTTLINGRAAYTQLPVYIN